jgi:beta-xylosidase
VDWVDPDSYSMWAPDCIEKDGQYFFYFPSREKNAEDQRGFSIGVAVN